jgi:hypothetical protein
LRPKNPILRIQPGPSDEITAISQEFTVQQPKAIKKVAAPSGPIRIQ